jgi:hypothetical protein
MAQLTSQQQTVVKDVIRRYYEANKRYGDLTVAYDAPKLLAMAEAALEAEGQEVDAVALSTEIEGNITTGVYKLSTDNDLLVYLFFAGLAIAVYFYFKYKIIKQEK